MIVSYKAARAVKLGGTTAKFVPSEVFRGFFVLKLRIGGANIRTRVQTPEGGRKMANNIPTKIYLSEEELPRQWYNLRADMKEQHDPFLHPGTLEPIKLEELTGIFVEELSKQELNFTDRFIDIPEGVCEFYKMIRPSPLIRAYFLEKILDTPAEIYYKFEGTNTSGSHKLNSAIAQAYYAKEQGLKSITTETGAGQWGTALAMACSFYGLDVDIFMVKGSADQKPDRLEVMKTYGASVTPSPSNKTEIGKKIQKEKPGTTGSLGCAISEAIEVCTGRHSCKYVLGSVLDYVLLHQSIIGLELKKACDKYDINPDIIIGCAGGGSNLGGLIGPYMGERIKGKNNIKFIAVEPKSCPSFTRGKYSYDFGDTGKITPLLRMYTLGNGFIPSPIHAGGLRYHGMSPILSKLYHDGYLEAVAVGQKSVFDAAAIFSKCEGILPAPESSHAIKVAIDEALKCKEEGQKKTIIFGLTGTGYFDMSAYRMYNAGKMEDTELSEEDLQKGFDSIPAIPQNK